MSKKKPRLLRNAAEVACRDRLTVEPARCAELGTDAGPDVIENRVRDDERLAEPGDDTLDHASRLIAELGDLAARPCHCSPGHA